MDRELLIDIAAISEISDDTTINHYEIDLLFTGSNGIYACVKQEDERIYDAIKNKLCLRDGQLFLFVISDGDTGSFYDHTVGFVEMENVYDAFQNCYYNHLIPQADLYHISFCQPSDYCKRVEYEVTCENYEEDADQYVAPVISEQQLLAIRKRLDAILEEPVYDGNYRIYPDGRMELKRIVTESVAGISTFVEKGTAYFPCMETDGDQFFLITLFGGLLGLHKFKTGNYLRGIIYALTFGCCGIFYILDLISIITGGYSYRMILQDRSSGVVKYQRKQFYSRPLKNKKRAIFLTILAAVVAFILVKFVYIGALRGLTVLVSEALAPTSFGKNIATVISSPLN